MKRLISITLLTFLAVAAWSQQPVNIPDPNLRQAISDQLALAPFAPITQAEMLKLERLDARDRGIVDITGLEHATNLTSLVLADNDISTLDPLTQLVQLEQLWMWSNHSISDITPLSNLIHMTHLHLAYSNISGSLDALARMTNLVDLYLEGNNIGDIGALQHLTRLEVVRLGRNNVVDVKPLINLTNLRELELHLNPIRNLHLLDHFVPELIAFTYDETCDMLPDRSLLPRIKDRRRPSVGAAWSLLRNSDLPRNKQVALHGLYFGHSFSLTYDDIGNGTQLRGLIEQGQSQYDEITALNPHIVLIRDVHIRDNWIGTYPDDSPFWVKDANGQPVPGFPGTYLLDFTNPVVQDIVVEQVLAVSKCGFYDGIFLDWWSEYTVVLEHDEVAYRTFEAEQQARLTILQRIRANTRDDFLIIVNHNRAKLLRHGQYINGSFMETLFPGNPHTSGEDPDHVMKEIAETILWNNDNLRQPHVTILEGAGRLNEPTDSPLSLQWMRAFTAMSLTLSDTYVIYTDSIPGDHGHIWYDFWDADVGQPVSDWGVLYNNIEGCYIREYTNGWVVYNHSGAAQQIALPEETQSVSRGLTHTVHAIPNLDGAIYLRVAVAIPGDANGDGVVNILDLVFVAKGFGTQDKAADLNGDGVVNVFDLVLIANQL